MRVVKERKKNHGRQGRDVEVQIKSPWHSLAEAAEYLGVSRAYFCCNCERHIPYGLAGRVKRWHQDALDQFARDCESLLQEANNGDAKGECPDIRDSG